MNNKIIKFIISFIKSDRAFYPVTRKREFKELSPFFRFLLAVIIAFFIAVLVGTIIK
jgi:hypothetical protein